MRDNGRATFLTPPSSILLKPAIGGVRAVAFSISLMNRFKQTESDTFAPCIICLLLKDLLFRIYYRKQLKGKATLKGNIMKDILFPNILVQVSSKSVEK